MKLSEISEISKMSIPEKILLVEDLWDSIAALEADVPIPESHQKELNRRLEKQRSSPGELLSMEELQNLVEKRK